MVSNGAIASVQERCTRKRKYNWRLEVMQMLLSSTTEKVDDAAMRRQTMGRFREGLLTEQGSRYLRPEVTVGLNNAVAFADAIATAIGIVGEASAPYVYVVEKWVKWGWVWLSLPTTFGRRPCR